MHTFRHTKREKIVNEAGRKGENKTESRSKGNSQKVEKKDGRKGIRE